MLRGLPFLSDLPFLRGLNVLHVLSGLSSLSSLNSLNTWTNHHRNNHATRESAGSNSFIHLPANDDGGEVYGAEEQGTGRRPADPADSTGRSCRCNCSCERARLGPASWTAAHCHPQTWLPTSACLLRHGPHRNLPHPRLPPPNARALTCAASQQSARQPPAFHPSFAYSDAKPHGV